MSAMNILGKFTRKGMLLLKRLQKPKRSRRKEYKLLWGLMKHMSVGSYQFSSKITTTISGYSNKIGKVYGRRGKDVGGDLLRCNYYYY